MMINDIKKAYDTISLLQLTLIQWWRIKVWSVTSFRKVGYKVDCYKIPKMHFVHDCRCHGGKRNDPQTFRQSMLIIVYNYGLGLFGRNTCNN